MSRPPATRSHRNHTPDRPDDCIQIRCPAWFKAEFYRLVERHRERGERVWEGLRRLLGVEELATEIPSECPRCGTQLLIHGPPGESHSVFCPSEDAAPWNSHYQQRVPADFSWPSPEAPTTVQ